MEPLSMMAPAKRPRERGERSWTETEREPADWPAMVTRAGSPPKAAMLDWTHWRAAFWSRKP